MIFFIIVILIIISIVIVNINNKSLKYNIIQTWKDTNIPIKYQKLVNKIKTLNKSANYIFFTDKDIKKFIKQKYPQYLDVFNNFKFTIQKIDFFRYLAIYHYGGIYLDLDIEVYKSFRNLIDIDKEKAVFPIEFLRNTDDILRKQGMRLLIGNYAFYAPKKHPFLKKIIDNVVNNRIKITNYKDKNKYVYYTTGPVMVTQSYLDFSHQKNTIKLIKPDPFKKSHFGEYGRHRNMGSWK